MNVFTNLLFSQDRLADPHAFDADDERYARGFGNRIASARFFAPLGHARAKRADDAADFRMDADLAVGGCG
jgi:hypothetical protein